MARMFNFSEEEKEQVCLFVTLFPIYVFRERSVLAVDDEEGNRLIEGQVVPALHLFVHKLATINTNARLNRRCNQSQ